MAYEPLTPYKSKDDPLWYVFDEDQNFKSFDTRDKALKHIRATKFPLNEGIDLDTAYNAQNKKIVQNRNAKIDSFNVAEGYDVKPIEPIKPPKIVYATDEKKEEDKQQPSALSQFGASFGQGTRIGFTNLVDYARARNELGVTASEGYYDKPIDEYSKEHQKAIDIFNKDIMAKGKINDNEYIEKILKDNNLNRSYVEGGKILTRRTKEEEDKLIANSVFSQQAKKINQWAMSNPLLVDSWEDIDDSWLNSLAQAVPSFLIPLTASIATRNPYIMMTYGGIQMYSDTYTTAEEYLDEGKITREEANTLANYVGAVSLVTNYLPFKDIIGGTKLTKKILFDKAFEKGLHKKISTETFKKFTYEALQESVEEIASLSAEFTYRDDMTYEEVKSRLVRAYTIGGVLGGVTGGAFATLSKPQQKKHIDALVKQRNSVLPYKMNIDSNGNLSFNIKEEDFDSKKEYETIKKVLNDPDFKRRINPFNLAKKNPDTPVEFLIFDELNNENPNTDDVDIEYNKKLMTSIMTDEDIRKANYDPDNPQWLTAELQEGDEGYEEGKRKFKVHTLGSNIYNSSGGSIVLSEGVSQDVFVEELTEVLYKKLATTNPKLKRRIDRWIKKTTKILDNNKIGGPRNIELFSKFYTFNYLGYADTEFDLGQIAKMPKGILKDFDAIMGEQKDGTNLSFLFKGKSKGDVITETETDVDENSQTVETPEESFRLTPQQEEFFKDSKVKEPFGELTQVYHGTASEDFEAFDPSAERGEWKVLGDGVYFSRFPQQANNYTMYGDGNPRVIPAYLNLKNPFIIEGQGLNREIDTPTEPTIEEKNRLKEEQIKHKGKDLGYWYDNWLYLPNDIKRNVLMEFGYDGVMDGNVYVAFKPEQIKSQFNQEPTSDPRMSYRLMVDPDYQMDHRPTEGPRAFDLLEKVDGDNFAPKDIYEEPRHYIGSTPNDYSEFTPDIPKGAVYNETIQFMNFLKQNKDNPDATVTIYRASPQNTLNIGDWITPSKSYAKGHSKHYEDSSKDLPVYEFPVALKNIKWAGDTLEEWGYFPDKSNTKVELFNETNGKEIDTEESFALAPAVDDFSDIVKALSNVDLIDAIDVEKFADNKEIGNYLVERIQQLQKENNIDLKTKTGEYTDEQIKIISDVIVRETLNEIVNNPKNAGAWYSTNMENAIKLLGIIYPEILSNKNSRTTFVIGLAITSNGQTPEDNLRYALQVYDFYKEKNRFPETEDEFDSAGSVSPSMREGFVKYNSLVTMFGLDDANQFLNTRFKVGEINYITGHKPSKEKVDQILPGSAIFGPKIGGAFYPNLQGAYEYVTMDRWFMRTMGRITGELINNVEDLKPQINRFRNTLLKTKGQIVKLGHKKTGIKLDEKKYPLQFKYNRKKIIKEYNIDENLLKTDDDYAIEKASEILRPYANDGFKNKTELNLATNNLVKKVIELIDSPRNGGQIISFRKIMKLATDKVNQKVKENNIEFSKLYPADLQAIIWFPEKRLYSKLRKSKSILRETSYEDEAKKILQSRGYDDKRIADILNTNEEYATKGGAFNQENEKSYRLAPKDPDELTPEVIDELDRAEKLPQIYSQPPRESKFSISKKFNIDYKAGRSLEKVLKPISSALEKIHPKLKRALRDFEYRLLTKTRQRRIIVKNFYDKAKSMSQEDYYHLDLAFKNADGDKINELIKKYKLKKEYNALRKMLDDQGQEYVDAGGELGYMENYIPRKPKDLDGLRQNMFGLDPKLQTLYKKLEKQAIKEKGKELDPTEKEHIINMIMRGYKTLNEGKPGSAKPRVIKLVDNDMNEYYYHSSEALMNHIEQMTDVIEKRNFLGKNELTEDGIAKYIREVNEETPLTQDQEMAIKEILNARINPAVTSRVTGAIKNSTYIMTMGNPLSAITQLGDLVWAYDQAGVFITIKTIFGKKKIRIEDLGIEKIGQEFTSSTPLAGAVDRIFKIVGIAKIDKLGKETLINSVFNRYVKEAKKGKPSKQLSNDIDRYFDSKDSKKIKKLMKDLKQGKITEDVQILVFNKLLDHQPVTQSEMPQVYLQSGGGRLLYQLKTFTIRQLDVIRGKFVNDIVKAKTYKEKALGLGMFLRFLALWVFAGATKDIIKDLILGRPVDNKISLDNNYIIENLLQFSGVSRYHIYNAKRNGIRGLIYKFVGPPSVSIAEEFLQDMGKLVTDKKLTKKQEKMTTDEIEELRGDEVREDAWNFFQRVPVVGKIAFWRSKSGRNRILKQKLRELKDELDTKSVSNKDIEKYEEYLEEALSLDMITPTLYKKRLLQLYKQ